MTKLPIVPALVLGGLMATTLVVVSQPAEATAAQACADRDTRALTTGLLKQQDRVAPEATALPGSAAWLLGAAPQRAVEEVSRATSRRADHLGTYIDQANRVLVVVLDESVTDEGLRALGASLNSAAQGGPAVRVERGCESVATLEDIKERVLAKSWKPAAMQVDTLLVRTQPENSTVEVSYTPASDAIGDALRQHFGAAVTLKPGAGFTLDAGTRVNDRSPHYGGAQLLTRDGGQSCTAGYTVVDGAGRRWMTTASHCRRSYRQEWFSTRVLSDEFMGYILDPAYLSYDATLIGSTGQSYTNVIHSNGRDDASPTRPVDRVIEPAIGHGTCVSGSFTGATCNLTVFQGPLAGNYTLPDGSTRTLRDLWAAARGDGVRVSQGGDSGAPVYGRYGAAAGIKGLHIGRVNDSSGNPAADSSLFHSPSAVSTATGTRVLTTP